MESQNVNDALWDAYIQYKEYASRCQMEIKSSGTYSEENRVFYYPPEVSLLKEPEK